MLPMIVVMTCCQYLQAQRMEGESLAFAPGSSRRLALHRTQRAAPSVLVFVSGARDGCGCRERLIRDHHSQARSSFAGYNMISNPTLFRFHQNTRADQVF